MKQLLAMTVALFGLVPAIAAECTPISTTSVEYDEAVRRVLAIPEVKAWTIYLQDHPPARLVTASGDTTPRLKIGKQCYIDVTLYTDEGTHLHRLDTFFVSLSTRKILVQNIVDEPDPMPLSQWQRRQREYATKRQ